MIFFTSKSCFFLNTSWNTSWYFLELRSSKDFVNVDTDNWICSLFIFIWHTWQFFPLIKQILILRHLLLDPYFSAIHIRGHSITKWTKIYPILTPTWAHLPRVDEKGHFMYYLPFDTWHPLDFLLTPSSCPRSYWMTPKAN